MKPEKMKTFEKWFFNHPNSNHIDSIINHLNNGTGLPGESAKFKDEIVFIQNNLDPLYFQKCKSFFDIQKGLYQISTLDLASNDKELPFIDLIRASDITSKDQILNELGGSITHFKVKDIAFLGSEYKKHSSPTSNDGGYGIKIVTNIELQDTIAYLEAEQWAEIEDYFDDNENYSHTDFGIFNWARNVAQLWAEQEVISESDVTEYAHRISLLYPLFLFIKKLGDKYSSVDDDYFIDVEPAYDGVTIGCDNKEYTINYSDFYNSNKLTQELVKEKLHSKDPIKELSKLFTSFKMTTHSNVLKEKQMFKEDPSNSDKMGAKEEKMNTVEDSMLSRAWETTKDDGKEAGKRIAVAQTIKLIREPLIQLMAERSSTSKKERNKAVKFLTNMFASDIGEAMLCASIGTIISNLPIPGVNESVVAILAKEIRVQGYTKLGTTASDYFLEPIKEILIGLAKNVNSIEEAPQQIAEAKPGKSKVKETRTEVVNA